MPFDWTEFVRFAEALALKPAAGCSTEASQRAAVSRAYYGVVIAARNAVEKAGGSSGRGSSRMHSVVAQHMTRHSDRDVQAAGLSIADMRRLRNEADYDDDIDSERVLRQQLAFARLVEPALSKM